MTKRYGKQARTIAFRLKHLLTFPGEMVIYNMRQKKPAYNLISNNCQNFAVKMLEAIHVGAHRKFATSFAVYQRAIGDGRVRDLFVPDEKEEETETVSNAQHVMDENTTQLDNHRSLSHPA